MSKISLRSRCVPSLNLFKKKCKSSCKGKSTFYDDTNDRLYQLFYYITDCQFEENSWLKTYEESSLGNRSLGTWTFKKWKKYQISQHFFTLQLQVHLNFTQTEIEIKFIVILIPNFSCSQYNLRCHQFSFNIMAYFKQCLRSHNKYCLHKIL